MPPQPRESSPAPVTPPSHPGGGKAEQITRAQGCGLASRRPQRQPPPPATKSRRTCEALAPRDTLKAKPLGAGCSCSWGVRCWVMSTCAMLLRMRSCFHTHVSSWRCTLDHYIFYQCYCIDLCLDCCHENLNSTHQALKYQGLRPMTHSSSCYEDFDSILICRLSTDSIRSSTSAASS